MNQSDTTQPKRKGGKRAGAGRKPGVKTKVVLEREATLKAFRERAMKHADILFNSQITIARGQTFLYKIEKELIIGPKGGKTYRSKKPELVTSQYEIEMYLEGLIEEGDKDDENDRRATYYFLTTKEPNNNAIDSLLDRTFGKSAQSLEIKGTLNIAKILDEAEGK